jgi:hypothetical protein
MTPAKRPRRRNGAKGRSQSTGRVTGSPRATTPRGAASGPAPAAPTTAGARIRAASWAGTGAFALTAVTASLVPALEAVAFGVAVLLFIAGCVVFFAAYARGVARTRTDQIAVTSLFLLAGSAPSDVRRSLLASLAAEVVVALATAIGRPYTSLAAGTLVPLYGLALCGLWAARHGTFPARPDPAGRRRR